MPIRVPPITREWHARALGHNDVWSRFLDDWIAFNAFYDARFPAGGDAVKIKAACADNELVANHIQLLNYPDYQRVVDWFIARPGVLDMRPKGLRKTVANRNDWAGLLQCLYQVRNNLIHGDKGPQDNEDEQVVAHAAKGIQCLLESLIAQHVP